MDVEKRRKARLRRDPEQQRQWYKEQKKINPARIMLPRLRQKQTKKFPYEPCDLTPEDLIIPTHCPVFGYRLRWESFWRRPTVDRIDHSKGYVRGNILIVSQRANQLRSNASLSELRALVRFYQRYE